MWQMRAPIITGRTLCVVILDPLLLYVCKVFSSLMPSMNGVVCVPCQVLSPLWFSLVRRNCRPWSESLGIATT